MKRQNELARRHLFVAALMSSAAISGTAFGQVTFEGETQFDPDELGVNMSTGSMYYPDVELSIGDPDNGGLVYRRTTVASGAPGPAQAGDNYNLSVTDTTYFDVWSGVMECSVNVTLGVTAKDFWFDCTGMGPGQRPAVPVFTQEEEDGTSLVAVPIGGGQNDLVYTDRDGTKIRFVGNDPWVGKEISRPNGEIIKLDYSSPTGGSLLSVTNNYGYQLWFEHQSGATGTASLSNGKIIALNNAVESCPITQSSCTPLLPWPTLTVATPSYNNSQIADSAGNVHIYSSAFTTTGTYDDVVKTGSYSLNGVTLLNFSIGPTQTFCCGPVGSAVSQVTTPAGTWSYDWTATANRGRLDPLGNRRVVNSLGGRLQDFTNELGAKWKNFYDLNGNLIKAATPLTTYDGAGQPVDAYTLNTYDNRGNRLTSTWIPKSGSGLPNLVTSAGYDATCNNPRTCNQPIWTRDALGNQTDYTYDPTHGGVLTVTKPAPAPGAARPQVRYSYSPLQAYYKDSSGAVTASGTPIYKLISTSMCLISSSCSGQAEESKVVVSYGAQSASIPNNLQPVSTTRSSGDGALSSTVTSAYDAVGNRVSVDGPLPGSADTTVYRYDALRRLVGEVSPDPDGSGPLVPAARKIQYDTLGHKNAELIGTVPDQSDGQWTNFNEAFRRLATNDNLGQPVRTSVQASGVDLAVKDQLYDHAGRVTCTIDRMDPASWGTVAASCIPQQTSGANGPDRVTKYTRDAAGQLTQVQRGYGTASVATETSGYTSTGRVAYVVDAQNNRTTYEYDGSDRLGKTFYPVAAQGANTSSTTDYEQLTYGDGVHVTAKRLRDGSTTAMTYDNLGRLTSLTPQGEAAVSYAYNLADLPVTIANGTTVTRSYDALGRLTGETQPAGGISYQYDAADRLVRLTWSDGFYANYDYNAAGWPTAIRENGAVSGIGVLAAYTYDSLGRRDQVSFGNGTARKYEFDPVGRLRGMRLDLSGTATDLLIGGVAGAGTGASYNPASQLTSLARSNAAYAYGGRYNVNRSYWADGLNRYSAAGAVSFSYDARGNLTNSGATTFGYNRLDQLTSGPNGAALSYDGAGRLAQFSASGTTRFYYAGAALAAETDGTGTILRRYVPGPGTDEPIVWYEGAGTADRRWLQADERGSIVAVSDAAGAALAINAYDEYGIPQAGNLGRFQYTGQTWLSELGMYYYKARMYSPTLGRFMQTDPIGYGDGLNWYAYVGNDPVNGRDPSGLHSVCVVDDSGSYCSNGGGRGGYTFGSLLGAISTGAYLQPFHWLNEQLQGRPKVEEKPKPQSNLGCKIGKALKVSGDVYGKTAAGASVLGAAAGAVAGSEGGPAGSVAGALGGMAAFAPHVEGGAIVSSAGQLIMDVNAGNYRDGAIRFGVGVGLGRALNYYLGGALGVGSFLNKFEREGLGIVPDAALDRLKGAAGPISDYLDPPSGC